MKIENFEQYIDLYNKTRERCNKEFDELSAALNAFQENCPHSQTGLYSDVDDMDYGSYYYCKQCRKKL